MKQLIFIFAAILVLGLLAACAAQPAAQTEAPAAPVVQQPAVQPTVPPPPPEPAQTEAPAATEPQYAPFCADGGTAACSAPQVDVRDQFCTEKVPYTLLGMPVGTTYEVLTDGFSCGSDYVLTDGVTNIVTCTGPELQSFQLKVCDPSCVGTDSSMGMGLCPDGYTYDPNQQCCNQAQPSGQNGCVEMTIDINACPGPKK
jgi:hypothetical protein